MIPIFLACDENYVKYAAVTISSIISNTNSEISFYILDGGIEEESKSNLSSILCNTKHSLEFISVNINLFKDFPYIKHFSLNTYSRFLIPDLKPELEKALYIDTDMVVCGDIAEIYNKQFEGKGIAVVAYMDEDCDPKLYSKYKKRLNIQNEHRYFNAGLLLIDCEYWRKHNIVKQLMEKTFLLKDIIEMPDQDILNIVFESNYRELEPQYNLVVDLTARYQNFNQYISNISGCYILHYTGGQGIRPWINKSVPGANCFWKYAKLTPFYKDLVVDLSLNQTENLHKKIDLIFPGNFVSVIRLFNVFPIIKVKYKSNRKKVYLFGFIPLYTISRRSNA